MPDASDIASGFYEVMIMNSTLECAFEKKFLSIQKNSYNFENNLIYENITQRNYHTAISSGRVHRTRENTEFAIGLLQTGTPENVKNALHIFRTILALQDKKPDSPTFGIWPYLLEEPIENMLNPDWNWASFISRTLIISLIEFEHFLPDDLKCDMKQALKNACISIQRRNMGADYTNICIMSSFVIALSGEILQNSDFIQFGLNKLEHLIEFINKNGSISEYNSPYYGLIDLEENGRILKYAKTLALKNAAKTLNNTLWRDMAHHFHSPTGQLAPPHTRCYGDICDDRLLSIFEIGTNGIWNLLKGKTLDIDLLWMHTTLLCPEEYISFFAPLTQPRFTQMEYYKGFDTIDCKEIRVLTEKNQPPITATTWLHPYYCVGSFNRHDMWNQRRPLMAYLKSNCGVAAFKVRCMHDKMDFSSAIISTAQIENETVSLIGFVTDHGDYHYILDQMENATITADKFYIRFEMNGDLTNAALLKQKSAEYIFSVGSVYIKLNILDACFDNEDISIETFTTETSMGLDIVLQNQPNSKIDFSKLKTSYICFSTHFYTKNESSESSKVQILFDNTKMQASLLHHSGNLYCTEWINSIPEKYINSKTVNTKIYKNGGFLYV
ncbi:MAG: hypothetical protein PHG02_02260 [Oscillospiraceae bacterium]|nr:hypothetical protein [Oscillospiraceae bacterium]